MILMLKAISTVIASILMLMIVIALGGTSYLYISGTFTGKIATAFEVIDEVNGTVTIRNSGTETITRITATLNGNPVNTVLDLNNNLVGYWKMNEGNGTITKDSSGKGNDGNLVNNPTWVDGESGKALQFDGINNDVVKISYSTSLDHGTGEFTWMAWIKLDTLGKNHTIGSNYNAQNPYTLLQVGNGNKLSFSTRDSTGATGSVIGDDSLNSNTWYHVAITRSGNAIKVFLNSIGKSGTGPTGDTYRNSAKFNIGAHPTNGGQTIFTDLMQGTIDEVKIYNKALTENEINALYVSYGETILEPGQIVTVKPITTLSKGTHNLRLCTSSVCNAAILTIQ